VGAKFLSAKYIFCRVSFAIPSQGQTHRLKQLTMLQKRLQTPQIVLISLNFCPKTPNEHKKIHQALYQYLMDLMVAQDGFEPSTCRV